MNVDPDFLNEEIRCGYKVTAQRKKIWHTQLKLLETFDKICRKHDLKYFACYGTLLGAVRHKGFIPWDDDVDLVMFRDAYEILKAVIQDELTDGLFFQNTYTCESVMSFSRLVDLTADICMDADALSAGVFIDIFPLDDVPDGVHPKQNSILEIQKDLWMTCADPKPILMELLKGNEPIIGVDVLADLLAAGPVDRFAQYESFCASHFGESAMVGFLTDGMAMDELANWPRDWFNEIVYLPFEGFNIPAPSEYDKVLERFYGDYRRFVIYEGHEEFSGIL